MEPIVEVAAKDCDKSIDPGAAPCPSCQSPRVAALSGGPGNHWIMCLGCGLQTDDGSYGRRIRQWNELPRLSTPSADLKADNAALVEAGQRLAFAAGALNIATDSRPNLRGERGNVLDALKGWNAALQATEPRP